MQHNEFIEMNGAEILEEDLRQYCIFMKQSNNDKDFIAKKKNLPKFHGEINFFFLYVKTVHDVCRNRITPDCASIAMTTLGINEESVDQCIQATFESTDSYEGENYVFSKFAQEWKNYGHNMYPSMIINGKTFRGRLTPDNVFEAICASFVTEPRECRAWQEEEGIALPKG